MPSDPLNKIANANLAKSTTKAGQIGGPLNFNLVTGHSRIPSSLTEGTTRGVINDNPNMRPPLGSAPVRLPVSSQTMSQNISNLHDTINDGIKFNESNKQNLPFLNTDQSTALATFFNSPSMSSIIKESQSATLNSAGLTGDIPASIRHYQNTQRSRGLSKEREQIKNSNKIFQAQKQLMAAEEFFYRIIKEGCPTDINNPICKNFKNLQEELLNGKIEKVILNNNELQKKTTEEIILYNEQTISLIRLKELLATRIEELSQLEKEINNLNTSIRNNTRNNFYEGITTNSAKELQIYLMFFYYQIFIFYLFISNFFPNENYTKIFPIILVILYLIFPLGLQVVVIFTSDLFSKIQENLGIAPREKHLINKNI